MEIGGGELDDVVLGGERDCESDHEYAHVESQVHDNLANSNNNGLMIKKQTKL